MGTEEGWDVCLCCGGGEWVEGLEQDLEGWGCLMSR